MTARLHASAATTALFSFAIRRAEPARGPRLREEGPRRGSQIPRTLDESRLQRPPSNGARLSHSTASSMDFTCHSQKPPISSLVSVKGPSIIVRCCPENLTRLPLELGCNPSPASITPAFTSSSLNFPMAAKVSLVFLVGRTPASESLSALTITITRIVKSPCGTVSSSELVSGPSRPAEPGLYLHVERRPAESTSSISYFDLFTATAPS